MERIEIENKLKQIVAKICPELDAGQLDVAIPLVEQGLDSLDTLDYVLEVDDCFGVNIENEDYDNNDLGIVANMAEYLDNNSVS